MDGVKQTEKLAVKLRNCCGRAYLSLALISPIFLSGEPAAAQETGAAPPSQQTQAHGGHRVVSIDDRVKAFAKSLDLNEEQQAAVKTILEQRQQEILRIRLDTSIDGGARIARLRALQESTVERIRAVLNDEQRKHYDPLAARKLQPAPDQRSVEDWLKATTQK